VLRLNGERAAEGSRGLSSFFGRAPLAIAAAAVPPAAAVAAAAAPPADAAVDAAAEPEAVGPEEAPPAEEAAGLRSLCSTCSVSIHGTPEALHGLLGAGYPMSEALDALGLPRHAYCCRAQVVVEANKYSSRLETAELRREVAVLKRKAALLVTERVTKLDQLLLRSEESAGREAELLSLVRRSTKLLAASAAAGTAAVEKELRARSVDELAAECGMRIQASHLVCGACESQSTLGGVFTLNQRFSNLKTAVRIHLVSDGHVRAAIRYRVRRSEAKRRHSAALNCARAAVVGYLEAASFLSYPRRLLLLSLSGVDIGDINHSEQFPARFMSSVYAVMLQRIKDRLARPVLALGGALSSFAASEDNATQLNRTTTMAGGIIIEDGVKVAFMLGSYVAYSSEGAGEGRGVAEKLIECLSEFMPREELAERWVSLAADGAVILKHVSALAREQLRADESCGIGLWCPAHKLQLAAGDW